MKPSFALIGLLSTAALAAEPVPGLNGDALSRYQDAFAKLQSGAYGPATEVLNALAGPHPRVAEIFALRCSAQIGLGRFSASEADCAYALTIKANLASALYGRAVSEDNRGKVALAIGPYRRYAALEDPQAPYKPHAAAR